MRFPFLSTILYYLTDLIPLVSAVLNAEESSTVGALKRPQQVQGLKMSSPITQSKEDASRASETLRGV